MCITEQVNWNLYCALWFPYFGTLEGRSPLFPHRTAHLGDSEFSSCRLARVRKKSWPFSQADIVHFTSLSCFLLAGVHHTSEHGPPAHPQSPQEQGLSRIELVSMKLLPEKGFPDFIKYLEGRCGVVDFHRELGSTC